MFRLANMVFNYRVKHLWDAAELAAQENVQGRTFQNRVVGCKCKILSYNIVTHTPWLI